MHALLAVAIVTALAGATAYAWSGQATVQRQRVAINMILNKNDTGSFTLYALTPGPLEADTGAVRIPGFGMGTVIRNGMKVLNFEMGQILKGRLGTFGLPVRFDEVEMQNGVRVHMGTWKIVKGTGAYSQIKGGGRYVAVRMSNGRRLVRQEGWVTVTA